MAPLVFMLEVRTVLQFPPLPIDMSPDATYIALVHRIFMGPGQRLHKGCTKAAQRLHVLYVDFSGTCSTYIPFLRSISSSQRDYALITADMYLVRTSNIVAFDQS